MVSSTIGALPQASSVADDDLLVMEQQGQSMKLTGELLKRYAKQGVELEFQEQLDEAKAAADRAQSAASAVTDMTVEAHDSEAASVTKTTKNGKVNLDFGLPRGAQGVPGPAGATGPRGPQGPTGKGLTILGYYDTLADLQAAVPSPSPGDAYGVGLLAPYNIYVFDGVTNAWVDNGQLSGGGGGVLPEDVVTADGGAVLEFSAYFGDGPHTITFTEEEEPPLTAEDIVYIDTKTVKDAIDDLKSSVSDGKALVASAITDKGVDTAQDATFQQMAENIGQISGGTDTSDATATSFDILAPKTAYTAAGKVEGVIPSLAAQTITPGTADKTIANGQYLSGTQTIKGDANLTSANIKKGVTLFGVEGALESSFKATLTVTADAGAVVTATHSGGTEIEALSTNGTVVMELPLEGTWSVTAVRGVAQYNTVTIEVSSQYSAALTAEVHIEYYGEATGLSTGREDFVGTNNSQYALFGGGYSSGYHAHSSVDAYDQNLVHTVPNGLTTSRFALAATSVNDFSLFGGGEYRQSSSTVRVADVDAYSSTLTKSTPQNLSAARSNLAAATVGGYALFAGGTDENENDKSVDAYNGSLTRTSPIELAFSPGYNSQCYAASNENYAVFAYGSLDRVTAYDKNLTRSTPTVLSKQQSYDHAARAGNYILLALVESVDVYDLFLTRTTIEKAEGFGYGGTATTVRDFALFAYSDTTVYDPYLTRTIATKMNKSFRSGTASASIDDYALIAGGYYSGSSPYYDTVEAYRYV